MNYSLREDPVAGYPVTPIMVVHFIFIIYLTNPFFGIWKLICE